MKTKHFREYTVKYGSVYLRSQRFAPVHFAKDSSNLVLFAFYIVCMKGYCVYERQAHTVDIQWRVEYNILRHQQIRWKIAQALLGLSV